MPSTYTPPSRIFPVAVVVPALLSLSLVIFAHERTLVPLYGSGPTTYLLSSIVLVAMQASALHPFHIPLNRNLLYSALTLTLAPNATYWVGVWTSRRKNPLLGPAITHAIVLGPQAFALTTFLFNTSKDSSRPRTVYRLLATVISWQLTLSLAHQAWSQTGFLRRISDSQIYLNLACLLYIAWIASPFTTTPIQDMKKQPLTTTMTSGAKSLRLVLFAILWCLAHSRLTSPILPHPLPEPYTLMDYPLRILSSVQSNTGLISVAEILPRTTQPEDPSENSDVQSVRYLRASHSILGGVWMNDKIHVIDDEPPVTDSSGTPLGDSIYATFVLQEAVRLVNSTSNQMQEGLIIGLGTGISATAFQRHGLVTTIVEIDPAVYDAARQYFGLPDPGPDRVFLEDARAWVSRRKAEIDLTKMHTPFDFVVHDCFSGGGVPEHIYTLEFWNDTKSLLGSEGIAVVNYAGMAKSESSRMIFYTLLAAFTQCRAFHDLTDANGLSPDAYHTSFINIVIFCTNSNKPLMFRKSRKSDYLGSPLRRHVLAALESREVNLSSILDADDSQRYVITDKRNPLGRLQEAQGHHHWSLMREVLPDINWETY
ncbi:hypothetical protein AMATHDRAFT_139709 [Amanita thiersii Skay4041]|uniref:PABS domain-containing protein n=1 Tax=Amanita thiersii Skay4041 TaxID=703135 RepID=A0A2A9NXN4_9AGAR|nr:hypothetical protein AMATHDRAFT_139709 [Amanita thiersii Skay4041]